MFKKIVLICFICFFACNVSAECGGYKPNVKIEVIKDYGDVIFDDTKSRDEFNDVAGKNYYFHHDTMGLTIAEFSMSVESSGTQVLQSGSNYSCVFLDKIKLYLAYENIYVLIDKKYQKNSCQYNVILNHEKQHVTVHKKSLDYYAPYIAETLRKAAKNIKPRVIHNDEDVEYALSLISEELMYDATEILDFFEKERYNANAKLDTEENYEKERNKCPSW